MGAIVTQQFTHPESKELVAQDVHVDIRMQRTEDSADLNPKMYILLEPAGRPGRGPFYGFRPVLYDISDLAGYLLDNKRGKPLLDCYRTRLTTPYAGCNTFEVEDVTPNGLDAHVGDPVAILSDLGKHPEYKHFGIISNVGERSITLYSTDVSPVLIFLKGAFVENLSNRWHRETNSLGVKSQLGKLESPAFIAKRIGGGVQLAISASMHSKNTDHYDVYIRDKPIKELPLHWVPDGIDLLISKNDNITTYNGGLDAGGGNISDLDNDSELFIAVIAKSDIGSSGIYESNYSSELVL